MRAAVTKDTTVRTITLEVVNAPDIDVTTYHRKPRIFRPDTAIVGLVDGKLTSVKTMGGLVLKSGAASDAVREGTTYYPDDSWCAPKIKDAPEWVRVIAAEAPLDRTSWRTGTDAGEVQAL